MTYDELCQYEKSLPYLGREASGYEPLVKAVRVAYDKMKAIGDLVSENGCDCECDCTVNYEELGKDCEPCFACRIADVLGHFGEELKEARR